MANGILMDELHVTFFAPSHLAEAKHSSIHRVLNSKRFLAALQRAVRHVARQQPALSKVHVMVSR